MCEEKGLRYSCRCADYHEFGDTINNTAICLACKHTELKFKFLTRLHNFFSYSAVANELKCCLSHKRDIALALVKAGELSLAVVVYTTAFTHSVW